MLEALLADRPHRIHRGLQEFARIEFAAVLLRDAAEFAGHREAAIGVNIDLAHAVLDASYNLFDRHAEGLRAIATAALNAS